MHSAVEQDNIRKLLGEILLEQGMISPHQLAHALRAQAATGQLLGEQLVSAGQLDAQQLSSALSVQSTLR